MSMLSKSAFGLDIGDTSLKLVWLDNKKYIKSYNEIALAEGLIEKSIIKNKAKVVEVIGRLIYTARGDKIKTNRVVACLPEPKTFIKIIEIPATVKKNEMGEFILDEIHHYLPLAPGEIYIDWQVLSRRPMGELIKVLVGAVSRKIADDYFNLLLSANLKVEEFQIEAAAIANALIQEKKKKEASEESPQIIIDLGANRSSLILFDHGTIQFSISFPVSGIKITEEIASKFQISFHEAEKRKIVSGLRDASSPEYEIIEKNLRGVVKEINNSLKFYSQQGGEPVGQAFLCGGGAQTKKIVDYFSSKTNLKINLGNPFINIKPLKNQKLKSFSNPISFTTAIGLALRGLKM